MNASWEPLGPKANPRSLSTTTKQVTNESCESPPSPTQCIEDQNDNVRTQPRRSGRNVTGVSSHVGDPMDELLTPLTDTERQEWKGWVELESDPALFNFILRQYGVKDVKIQEVLSLEDEMLAFLPTPIYGLVFLFKYRDSDEQSEPILKCPGHIWFANQITTNACATVALLNIIMNVPDINLGESLDLFRATTFPLQPACRGLELGHNTFIRTIHNSFARKMDMRNADLSLSNQEGDWTKAQNAKRRKIGGKKSRRKSKCSVEEEPGFHFVAYVPANGEVWRLDGLQTAPENIGAANDNWMAAARRNIYQRIGQYDDDGLQFNLLALCKSPLKTIPEQLAAAVQSVREAEGKLDEMHAAWRDFVDMNRKRMSDQPNALYGVFDQPLSRSNIHDVAHRLEENKLIGPEQLLELRAECIQLQDKLRISYAEEVALVEQEDDQAYRSKVDDTPAIYRSVKALAEAGLLRELMREANAHEICLV